jgi:MFS family permease
LTSQKRFYYGWKIVLALSLTELTSWGILYYAFAVVAVPMQSELGWSRVAVNGAFSLALLIAGLAALPIGRWVDAHGTRALMTAGSCAAVGLVLAWSQVTRLWMFYLIWSGMGLALAALLYEPAFAAIATWFRYGRARALTVLTFFGGLASLIFIPLTERLIRASGWRHALVVLATIQAAVTILPHALVLRRRPSDLGLLPDGLPISSHTTATSAASEVSISLRVALAGTTFWWLAAAFALSIAATIAVTVSLIPHLLVHGYDSGFAALTTGALGALSVCGRLASVPFGQRLSRQTLAVALFGLQAIALVLLLQVNSRLGVVAFVVLFGASSGALTPLRASLLAEHYGPAAYGAINGAQALLLTLARAVAPVGVGLLYNTQNSYVPVYWLLVALSTLAAVAASQLSR